MDRYYGYYSELGNNFNNYMPNTKHIIDMDIKRTHANIITPDIKNKMIRILYNYSKRNMEIGYCQGMNYMCFNFLQLGFEEEETFWILVNIFENLIPKNYYVSMIPIIADTKMLKYILNIKYPLLVKHIQDLNVDIDVILIPWFIMAFTNLPNLKVIL